MKKTMRAICVIACLSAALFSCKGKNADGTNQAKTAEKAESAKVQQTAPSLFIYSGWDLYEERDDGKMYAVREAESGDAVEIYLTDDGSIEQKNAVRHLSSGKEDSLDFVRVRYEGADFWTRDIFVSGLEKATVGVVSADTFAYSAPSGSAITGTQIAEGTVVALIDYLQGDPHFDKAVLYNGTPFGKEVYIKGENVFPKGDFFYEPVLVFKKIDENTKPEVRDEILMKIIDSGVKDMEMREYTTKKLVAIYEKAKTTEHPLPEYLENEISLLIATLPDSDLL